ncbi:hypothetical protein J9317_04510 [Metabacillus sp. KIGAM252]|uniref:Uncharacterized protein n=1 Tax=Metabacillus flavus TaxID=2823519 RepID=A0ABS5LBT2_9BACI|nr:hypothetical protein [Metabacillus flavus]MBS2968018.1 hypothetical protein [Metabacillus flavus]
MKRFGKRFFITSYILLKLISNEPVEDERIYVPLIEGKSTEQTKEMQHGSSKK